MLVATLRHLPASRSLSVRLKVRAERRSRKLRMAVWDKTSVCGLVFLLAGAVADRVNYPHPVCAVKGSTVTILCSFTPPDSVVQDGRTVPIRIIRVRWCQNHLICQGHTPSVYDSDAKNNNRRYKYLGDMEGNCTLQITDIQENDKATLRFRMEVNNSVGHHTGKSGVEVTVTDDAAVTINSSSADGQLTTGDSVTLYCTARCTFHQLEVTWFKDDHALSETGPALQLSPLTTEDSGNYSCGVKPGGGAPSLPYSLRVKTAEEGDGGSNLSLTVGVAFGVLLALFTLIMVVCIIRRKQAAAGSKEQRAAGDDVELKRPDDIYSNVLLAEQGGGGAAEDISYASVQFNHRNQFRPAEKAEDAIVYSSVVSRG